MKKPWILGALGIAVLVVTLVMFGGRGTMADVSAEPAAEPARASAAALVETRTGVETINLDARVDGVHGDLIGWGTRAALQTSATISVHVHNPEGVEIGSIQGLDFHPFGREFRPQLYTTPDGGAEVYLGLATIDSSTHPRVYAVPAGWQTIKAIFNGIELTQHINVQADTNLELTFDFPRVEATNTILGCLSASGGNTISVDYTVPRWSEMYTRDQRPVHFYQSAYPFTEWGTLTFDHPFFSVGYHWEGTTPPDTRHLQITGDWSYNISPSAVELAYAESVSGVDNWSHRYGGGPQRPAFTGRVYMPCEIPTQPFELWWTQGTNPIPLPSPINFYYVNVQIHEEDNLNGVHRNAIWVRDTGYYLGYAEAYYSYHYLQGDLGYDNGYWDHFPGSYFPPSRTINSANFRMSSVPYDLLGTGVGGQNQPPVASFTYSPDHPVADSDITFDASSSYDPDGEIESYNWDFGDGDSAEGEVVTHAYTETGEYTVALTVTDNGGLTDSTELTIEVKPIPVLLVHGYCSDEGMWGPHGGPLDFKQALEDQGFLVETIDLVPKPTNDSIWNYGSQLYGKIAQMKAAYKADQVDIVAHSLGGLAARAYAWQNSSQRDVRTLIMLGTPNNGSGLLSGRYWRFLRPVLAAYTLGFLCEGLGEAAHQMTPGSPFLRDLNSAGLQPSIENYYTIAGTMAEFSLTNPLYYTSLLLNKEPNDGVVQVPSVQALTYATHIETAVDHFHYDDDPYVFETIVNILRRASSGTASSIEAQQSSTEYQESVLIEDTVTIGEENYHSIPIDSTVSEAHFILARDEGELDFTLTSPGGTLITPAVAASDPLITYTNAITTLTGYDITKPEPGNWTAHVAISGTTSSEVDYAMLALFDSELGLSIILDEKVYHISDPVPLAARLVDASGPVTGATVVAQVESPDASTQTISLYDDGSHGDAQANDGMYFNLYTNTATVGVYEVTVAASGTIDSEQFVRETATTIWVEQTLTCIVTTTADSGSGSLRDCIQNASAGDTITFDSAVFPPGSPVTITLTSGLPHITQGNLTIDASNAGVIIDGSGTPDNTNGLEITSSGNTIKGLQILRFPENGIVIKDGAQNNTIGGNRAVGSSPTGEGNVLSGHGDDNGIEIRDSTTMSNTIIGNLIGTDATGTQVVLNTGPGIFIWLGANHNRIEGNVISGNGSGGIGISGSSTDYNTITGNLIGTDVNGTAAIPNAGNGVSISNSASYNLIGGSNASPGGPCSGDCNLISGNDGDGVQIVGNDMMSNTVSGNYIGTDASGTAALGNENGIMVYASYNLIGKNSSGVGNLISGNRGFGVFLSGGGAVSNTIAGNYIGTDASGNTPLPNTYDGVRIDYGAQYNVVGGDTADERNVISGNGDGGVGIYDPGTMFNRVIGNYVGLDASGTVAVPNGAWGVKAVLGASNNAIGGATASERNVISGNGSAGVAICGNNPVSNTVSGNFIGTDVSGVLALGNEASGVEICGGASHNTIGGDTIGEQNVIAYNDGHGVAVYDPDSLRNTITHNSIHSNARLGIELDNGGNTELAAPVITGFDLGAGTVTGTACANCTVEVFSDSIYQGEVFEGQTTADGAGDFTFTKGASTLEWTHLSSQNGDLPPPSDATQQTASLILDVDKDDVNDFVIGSRQAPPALVWYQRNTDGWTKYVIDDTTLSIEAGGAFHDIDGDGDLDIVMGGDYQSNRIWWWENPYPSYDPDTPWTRREIKNSGANKHHDQIFGDFDGDGQAQLVFWNQNAKKLFIADIPSDPKNTQPWTYTEIYSWSTGDQHEGLAKADINGDGKVDIVGGGRWFEHNGGMNYTAHVIDSGQTFGRVAAGQLKVGGRPEVVFVPGDGTGRLKWYEWTGSTWVGHDLLGFNVDHGHSLEVADIDGDGNLDIFCAEMRLDGGNADAKMWVFLGDGAGGFAQTEVATGYGNHESRVGDLDGDNDMDILDKPYNWDTPRVDVWLNDTHLLLDRWQRHVIDTSRPWKAIFITSADIDGDDRQDIITGGWWYKNPGRPDGAGDFTFTKGASLIGPHLTATATDADGDTSEFSDPAPPMTEDLGIGATATDWLAQQTWGGLWQTLDPIPFLAFNGFDWLRAGVTTLVTEDLVGPPFPPWRDEFWNSREYTEMLLQEGQSAQMNLYLFFFLSDQAAHAGHQPAPEAWNGYTITQTATALQQHTFEITQYYAERGFDIQLYEIGNEIEFGISGYSTDTSIDASGVDVFHDYQWLRENVWNIESTLLSAAIAGVRQADPNAQIVLHVSIAEYPGLVQAFFQAMSDFGVDYDYAALSYYPWFDPHPDIHDCVPASYCLELSIDAINSLGKQTIIAEYSFPSSPAPLMPMRDVPGYPFTPEGQATWIADFLSWCDSNIRIHNIFYFYPDNYIVEDVGPAALFFDDHTPKPALYEFNEPIAGLVAINDSPTALGSATTLTATVTAGSNVAYTWAFGDGAIGSGEVVTHTYPAAGVYTAVVTASNSVSVLTATTTVTITNAPPTLSGLPNQVFDHSTSPPGTIDLWAYASDAETPTSELTYTLEGTPPAGAGVTLDSNRYVTVNPSADWCGYTDVTVRVADPDGLWDSDTFRVAVTWSCRGPLPVPGQAAAQDEPIVLDLTDYEPQVGDGTGLLWHVTGEEHCTVSGEYSADDVLTFTPDEGFLGDDTVTLHMVYPWGSEATQELTLTWSDVDTSPPEFRLYLPLLLR